MYNGLSPQQIIGLISGPNQININENALFVTNIDLDYNPLLYIQHTLKHFPFLITKKIISDE